MSFDNFFTELFKALGRSLYFIMGAPNKDHKINWADFFTTLSVKIVIICILLLLFLAIYKAFYKLSQRLINKTNLNDAHKMVFFRGIKYFWLFASAIAIFAQLGVSYVFIKSCVRAVFAGTFFYFLWLFLDPILEKLFQSYELNASIKQLINNIASVIIVVLAMATLMKQFGFDLVSIVAGLGIVGIAVGFAAQSTLADFIAGITILIEQPFKIGDWVMINDNQGKVDKIALRTTRIRTRNNVSVILPNATVATAEVTNLSARQLSRYHVDFGIAYEADVANARRVILEAIEDMEHLLKHPNPTVSVSALADSSVNLILRYWITASNIDKQPKINEQLMEMIHKTLVDANIEIPYPHLQILSNK